MSILDSNLIDQEFFKVHHMYNLDDFKINRFGEIIDFLPEFITYVSEMNNNYDINDWNIYREYSIRKLNDEKYSKLFEYCNKGGVIEATVLNELMNYPINYIKNSNNFNNFINTSKLPYHKIIFKEIDNGFEIKFYIKTHVHIYLKIKKKI